MSSSGVSPATGGCCAPRRPIWPNTVRRKPWPTGEIVRQWAIDGHGIILRSTWDVGRDIAAGLLAPVLPQYFQPADVWAVYPSRLSVSAKVKVCVEFLEAWFAQGGMSAA